MAVAATAFSVKSKENLRAFPVICDDFTSAAVAVVYRESPPKLGFHFTAFGQLWEVVQEASPTRGAVAQPVRSQPPKPALITNCLLG